MAAFCSIYIYIYSVRLEREYANCVLEGTHVCACTRHVEIVTLTPLGFLKECRSRLKNNILGKYVFVCVHGESLTHTHTRDRSGVSYNYKSDREL